MRKLETRQSRLSPVRQIEHYIVPLGASVLSSKNPRRHGSTSHGPYLYPESDTKNHIRQKVTVRAEHVRTFDYSKGLVPDWLQWEPTTVDYIATLTGLARFRSWPSYLSASVLPRSPVFPLMAEVPIALRSTIRIPRELGGTN